MTVLLSYHVGLHTGTGPNDDVTAEARERTALRLLTRAHPGATYWRTVGVWHGAREPSLVFQVVDPGPAAGAERLARAVARAVGQHAVLLTRTPTNATLVCAADTDDDAGAGGPAGTNIGPNSAQEST